MLGGMIAKAQRISGRFVSMGRLTLAFFSYR
jgi:hypothetical protein